MIDNLSAISNEDIPNLLFLEDDHYSEKEILIMEDIVGGDIAPDIQFTFNNYQISSCYILPIYIKRKITAFLCLYQSKNNTIALDKTKLDNLKNLITLKVN